MGHFLKVYPEVYPSGPYASTRALSSLAFVAEGFRAPPNEMPEQTYLEHHLMVNLNEHQELMQIRAGKKYWHLLHPGDVVITPAFMPNAWRWDETSNVIAVTICPSDLSFFLHGVKGGADPHMEGSAVVTDPVFASLARGLLDAAGKGILQTPLYLRTFESAILERIAVIGGAKDMGVSRGRLSRGVLRKSLDFIYARLSGDIRVGEVAAEAGMSQYHFSRLFRNATGISPHRFILDLRLARAFALLGVEREKTVAAIAAETGFSDQSHFANAFRHRYGVSPSRCRGQ